MKIKIHKLDERAKLPSYAHGSSDDAGLDLYALEDAILRPGVPTLVRNGIAIELPPGYEAQIRGRSGLALKHGIRIAQGVGTIDPSYRGEIGVLLVWDGWNPNALLQVSGETSTFDGNKLRWPITAREDYFVYRISAGDRIAQMIVAKYEPVEWEIAELSQSERGAGGFGSSGK